MTKNPHFVWLGAGEAENSQLVDTFFKSYPNGKAVLVEARKNCVMQLNSRFENQSNYSIVPAVLYEAASDKSFYILSVPEFSALYKPTGLLELYPSLSIEHVEDIRTLSLNECIDAMCIDENLLNQLYIDIPSQAGDIVEQLINSGQLHKFSDLHVHLGEIIPLYENSITASVLHDLLEGNGYILTNINKSDPDVPTISYRLNPLYRPLTQVQLKLDSKTIEIVYLENKIQTQDQKISERDKKLADKNLLIAEKTKLEIELTQQLEVLRVKNKAIEDSLTLTQRKLILSDKLKDEYHKRYIDLEGRKNALSKEIKDFTVEKIQIEKDFDDIQRQLSIFKKVFNL